MIEILKNIAPFLLYILAIIVFVLALTGKVKYGIFFLMPLFPLQNVIFKLHQFPCGKDLNDFLLLAMLIGMLFYKVLRKESFFEKSPFNKLLFFYFIFTYISLWRGSSYLGYPVPVSALDPRVQTWKNYTLFFLIYFIVVNNIKNLKQIKLIILFMVFSVLLMNYYTANQIRWMSGIVSRGWIRGTFVSIGANEVAAFYATYTFVLLGILLFDKIKFRRLLFAIIILINIYCLLFIYSRGAYVAFIIGLIFFSLIKFKKFVFPLILILFFWQIIIPATVIERINQTTTEEGVLEESAEIRVQLWRDSLEIFEKEPLLGVGYNVFPYLGFKRADPHNIYIKVLLEQGVVGLMILLLFFCLSLKVGWRLYKTADDYFLKGLGFGFTACVIATVVCNLFGDRWTHLQLGAYYWVFLGLVVKGNIIVQERLTNKNKSKVESL